MDLRATLQAATKDAMKAKDSARLSTLRLIGAAIKDREIAARTGDGDGTLGDQDLIAILSKMVKQRQESAGLRGRRPVGVGPEGRGRDRRHPGVPAPSA